MNLKRFLPLIGIIALLILLYNFDFSSFLSVIDQIPFFYLILSFGSVVPIILISMIEWQYLLKKQGINVSISYSIKNILIGYFYGFITPGGIGAYTRAFYLENESKESLEKCFSNILIFNTIDLISLFLISLIGALVFSNIYPSLFFILFVFCLLWVIFFVFFLRKKTWNWILNTIFRFTMLKSYQTGISTSINEIRMSLPSKKDVIWTLIISIFGWLIRFSIFYIILKVFSIEMPYFYVIFIIAIANIIAMIPISIYGLGTRETVLISFFSIFNIPFDLIIGVCLFWYVLVWLLPSIIGFFISLFEGRKFQQKDYFFRRIKESQIKR